MLATVAIAHKELWSKQIFEQNGKLKIFQRKCKPNFAAFCLNKQRNFKVSSLEYNYASKSLNS